MPFGVPWPFLLEWSLVGAALLLALGAVPLAARRAPSGAWRLHAALALALGVVLTGATYAAVYGGIVPWWQVGAGYLASVTAPVYAAGRCARAAAARWPRRRWLAPALAGGTAVVLAGAAGARAARALLPDVLNAVQ